MDCDLTRRLVRQIVELFESGGGSSELRFYPKRLEHFRESRRSASDNAGTAMLFDADGRGRGRKPI